MALQGCIGAWKRSPTRRRRSVFVVVHVLVSLNQTKRGSRYLDPFRYGCLLIIRNDHDCGTGVKRPSTDRQNVEV